MSEVTAKHTRLDDGETFEHMGLSFKVEFEADEFGQTPWDDDGHGPVSDWTTRDKHPGERVLHSDRNSKRYYDFAEAVKLALKDGWDAPPYTGTKGERAARAAEADYERLRAWCNNDWYYIGVVVTLLDTDGNETRERESLWGIESDCEDYLTEVAYELAEEIAGRVGESLVVCQTVRKAQPKGGSHA